MSSTWSRPDQAASASRPSVRPGWASSAPRSNGSSTVARACSALRARQHRRGAQRGAGPLQRGGERERRHVGPPTLDHRRPGVEPRRARRAGQRELAGEAALDRQVHPERAQQRLDRPAAEGHPARHRRAGGGATGGPGQVGREVERPALGAAERGVHGGASGLATPRQPGLQPQPAERGQRPLGDLDLRVQGPARRGPGHLEASRRLAPPARATRAPAPRGRWASSTPLTSSRAWAMPSARSPPESASRCAPDLSSARSTCTGSKVRVAGEASVQACPASPTSSVPSSARRQSGVRVAALRDRDGGAVEQAERGRGRQLHRGAGELQLGPPVGERRPRPPRRSAPGAPGSPPARPPCRPAPGWPGPGR